MRTITMLDLRRDAKRWIEAVRPGRDEIGEDDPLLRIEDFAVDGPGDRLTNEEIDRLVYGT